MSSEPGRAVTRDGRELELADDPDGGQYVARVGGEVVAMVGYQVTDEIIVFTHTGTEPSVEGQGVGSALVRYALDDVRATPAPNGAPHRKVIAVCPFVAAYLARHADAYPGLDYRSRTRHVTD
ncbi:MAG: GNAT family N-acetyltransferase [Kineosporiaceae bacterium]